MLQSGSQMRFHIGITWWASKHSKAQVDLTLIKPGFPGMAPTHQYQKIITKQGNTHEIKLENQ